MSSSVRIFLAGHNGMVGSAIARKLGEIQGVELVTRSRHQLNLADQSAVNHFFTQQQIDQVYLAAARVGGIQANNDRPADFIRDNLQIQTNVIEAAHVNNVSRLLFLGSSCIYPRLADQPISEEALLTGMLEPTNEPYAVAKIAGIKMCESYRRQFGSDFRSVMPTNLYGPDDNFDPEASHALPALMRRFHEAVLQGKNTVNVWGSGRPRREFLHVDDMAAACCFVMGLSEESYWSAVDARCSHLNVGCGVDVSIAELADLIAGVSGFGGKVEFDLSRPDGTPRKLLNVGKLHDLGWQAEIGLDEGVKHAYEWMVDHWESLKA